jgi:hypothetical protein
VKLNRYQADLTNSPVQGLCLYVLWLFVSFPISMAAAEDASAPQRIEALEAQVQQLLKHQAEQQTQINGLEVTSVPKLRVERAADTAAHPPINGIQDTTLLPDAAPGTTIRFGGFIKVDFLTTQTSDGQMAEQSIGRATYLPQAIPVSGPASGVDYDSHAKFSRFNLGVDHVSEDLRIGGYIECDFFGNLLGNQISQNSYGVTLRHVYLYWNDWLFGQTWSNFMDISAFPETVDFVGPIDSAIFARQTQVRYKRGGFVISLENPETTLTETATEAQSSSDRGAWPNLIVRYGWKGAWGTFGVAGMLREVKVDKPEYSDSRVGWGLTAGGRMNITRSDAIFYQVSGGRGFSRYIGLSIVGDASLDPDTGNLHMTGILAGYAAWRHELTKSLRAHILVSGSDFDNNRTFSGPNATSRVYSARVNLIYSPAAKLDLGGELSYARREVESGADGDLKRVQFSAKYRF